MNLDERSIEIITTIINQSDITSKELSKKLNLSRNQIDYGLRKINDFLEVESYTKVTRSQKGYFIIDERIKRLFLQDRRDQCVRVDYISSPQDRVQLILLMLLTNREDLSLYHFTDLLDVSKNTILRDFSNVREYITQYNLTIHYSRVNGYSIKGKEWDIRKVIYSVVEKIHDLFQGEEALMKYGKITRHEIEWYKKVLELVEGKLNIKYSDKRIWTAPYEFAIVINRIKNGKRIENEFGILFNDLSDTREYTVINLLFDKDFYIELPSDERLYMTLRILTMNVAEESQEINVDLLNDKVYQFLELLEKKSAIALSNKQELHQKLYLHLKSAVYRIKYKLTIDYPFINSLENEYVALYNLIENSLSPLEEFVGSKFPKQEILFISIFIGSYILDKENVTQDIKATLVCPNGVIFSNLLKNQLNEMFPFIYFSKPISIREYQQREMELDVDIVFSSVPINSRHYVIVVEDTIDETEKKRIENEVFKRVHNFNNSSVLQNKVMQIIKKYIDLDTQVECKIVKEIEYALRSPQQSIKKHIQREKNLLGIINCELIQITEDNLPWSAALEKACEPLLSQGYISENYIKVLHDLYKDIVPNIILGTSMIIPHARPEDGSKKLGVSLLKLSNGIKYKKGIINYIAVVSTLDYKNHTGAMYQLLKIATNKEVLSKLNAAKNSQQIYEVLKNSIEVREKGDRKRPVIL
ncbi:PRD domain-containing protein [Alkalibaculum sp. M08DMB]|uniref:Ascorbate-specific PTS system EIIA component n=1 Tax=Alkalibaculum sporogenes TaxID=2655001 RepID=A0A6A7K825_9FIRM|nr:BglG family transcription antiterminator [Alkalibaculum sporogenes]MPW25367.1 PRD domain-containing protein [Alkalibaculum sporogenes]